MSETLIAENLGSSELARAGVHFGYARTRRHPRMREYLAGVKSNIEVFHLEKISDCLGRALNFLEELGKEKAAILWVGTKPAAEGMIQAVAKELGHPYVNNRWLGGTLTNSKIIRERITQWQDLLAKQKSGELAKYTKQEQLMIGRKIERMTTAFAGLESLDGSVRALFIVDTNEEINALREAQAKKLSTVALLNSDCDPEEVAYPIPGNDNAPKSVEYILMKAKEAYVRGRENAGN